MIPLAGLPVLTAAEMRAAEARAIADGTSVDALIRRAGEGVAEAVRRLAAGAETLILCGPGNNGGDGYVAAAALARAGHPVRLAALGEPGGEAAKRARAGWAGPVEMLTQAASAPILVDALFGTGLSRPLEDGAQQALARLAAEARLRIAVDLPSGVATDDGAILGRAPVFDVTLALGAPKPSHLLQPAARLCGEVRVIAIGVETTAEARVLARPALRPPGPDDHKYTRGMVAIVAGEMAGASLLAATAAMRAGAGYVTLLGGGEARGPHALVHQPLDDRHLSDPRIGALLVGPGLGRDAAARDKLARALSTDRQLVIDGDALRLLDPAALARRGRPAILTPHAGEFTALFGDRPGSKLDRTREAAARANAVVVHKGADTVVAAPDGRAILCSEASTWLSTAGTGDALAGAIAAMLAAQHEPIAAAEAGVWLHGEAARRCGASFIADDLAEAMSASRASLRS